MFYKPLIILCFCCCAVSAFSQRKVSPIPIIFDSDMGPDYDDVGAIAILHALADRGEAKILATMASTKYEGVAGVLNVFNTYFNRPKLPVGVPGGDALALRDWQHWTDTLLVKYPHQIKTNNQAWDAVKLYRKTLAGQPDHSVTIVTVGFLTNVSNLLNTGADEYSSLSGKDLIKKKVKQLVCMAGKFPAGFEFNVMKDVPASKNVFVNWPGPILFSGFEIGEKIKAGLPLINDNAIHDSPVKDVFRISLPKAAEDSAGRKSWDETAVLVAVRGYETWYTLHPGKITVATDGSNAWDEAGIGQAYLVEKLDYKKVQDVINLLIRHRPKSKTSRFNEKRVSRLGSITQKKIKEVDKMEKSVKVIEAQIKNVQVQIAKVDAIEKH